MTYGNKKMLAGLLMGQLAVTITLPALFSPLGWQTAVSVLIGGGMTYLLVLLQLWGLLRPYRAQNPGAILGAMVYVAAARLILVALLFALVFKALDWIVVWAVFVGFIISYLISFLVMHQNESRMSKKL